MSTIDASVPDSVAPHVVEQFLSGDASAVGEQQLSQQLILAIGQCHLDVADHARPRRQVVAQLATFDQVARHRRAASNERPQASRNQCDAGRLGEEIVGARVEEVDLVVVARLGAEHEDRRCHAFGA